MVSALLRFEVLQLLENSDVLVFIFLSLVCFGCLFETTRIWLFLHFIALLQTFVYQSKFLLSKYPFPTYLTCGILVCLRVLEYLYDGAKRGSSNIKA